MNKRINNRLLSHSNAKFIRFLIVFLVVLGVNSSFLFETAIAIAAPSPFRPKKQKPPQRSNKTPNKPQDDGEYDPPMTYLCAPPGGGGGFTNGQC